MAHMPGIIMQQTFEAILDISGSCFNKIRILSQFMKIKEIGNIRTVFTNLPLFRYTPHNS
jgi:hypothetical protein